MVEKGCRTELPFRIRARLAHSFEKQLGRSHALQARAEEGQVPSEWHLQRLLECSRIRDAGGSQYE